MIERRKVNNVLKRVFAAKTEEAPAEETQEDAPVKESPEKESPKGKPVIRKRYYFFDANPGTAIQFTAMKEILEQNSPEKGALIKKLQGGNSGRYFADYFMWKKICIITNEYGDRDVVYECDLSPFGAKITGSEKITPSDAPVKAEIIEKDLLLFDNKDGNVDIIQTDKSNNSYYIDKEPPENIARILLSKATPPGNILNYSDFVKKFDTYRIWVPNLSQLMLPDFSMPQKDDIQGGHYKGGEASFNKLVGPVKEDVKSEEPVEDEVEDKSDVEEKEKGTPFEPVDEQKKSASEKKKKKSKGDYASEPYSGGSNVMQNLVKDQRAHMDIRRASRKVVARFIEAAFTSSSPTSPTSPSSTKSNPTITITQDPDDTKKKSDALKNLSKVQEDTNKKIEQMNKDVSKF